MNVFALEFPEISHILVWPDIFPSFNKIAVISVLALVVTAVIFIVAGNKDPMKAPTGTRNLAESSIDFIEDGIIMQTMGRDGLGWTPLLLTMFFFIFFTNITEIIPTFQMPANARMAIPALLALFVWAVFNGVGIKHQGFFGYFKSVLFPPGVPKALYILVTPIEFISTILVRPVTLSVRLFANLVAGHFLLAVFFLGTIALLQSGALAVFGVFAGVFSVVMVGFEIFIALLQAFIFSVLSASYIAGAMASEH
jgi:F-type H+-transporting ATPase subunit a